MTDREKLIELLREGIRADNEKKEAWILGGKVGEKPSVFENMADHLIANDVTVQEWIPVTERLPELHTKVLCCGKKGGRFIAELGTWGHENHLCWDKKNGQGCPTVTHWMPMPQPPKEVEQ